MNARLRFVIGLALLAVPACTTAGGSLAVPNDAAAPADAQDASGDATAAPDAADGAR